MELTPQILIEAIEGKLPESTINSVIQNIRTLPSYAVQNLAEQANICITGDGNIIGNHNISIVVKGEKAAELESLLLEVLGRGRALHQLRGVVNDFVGREDEILELEKVGGGRSRANVAVISGMGGVGKTEFALKVAACVSDYYPDAQLFIDMRGADESPRGHADALARCIRACVGLDAKLPEEIDELGKMYLNALSGKRALIILDNVEDERQVKPLLPPRNCLLLVTSRNRIAISGCVHIVLNELKPDEAYKLIRTIAPHVDASNANQITSLCGYLPLAIRAAGSLLAVSVDLDPSDYVRQLRDERIRMERIGGVGVDTSVEACFNLSYLRQDPAAAKVFRQLTIFPASFDASAEQFVCNDSNHIHLSYLVRRSLVLYDRKTNRYRLHDLLKLFGRKKLTKEESYAASKKHSSYFLTLLCKADESFEQGGEALMKALLLFDLEWTNIQAGQAWAERHVGKDKAAARYCSDYPTARTLLLDLRQKPSDRIRWLNAGLKAARRLEDRRAEGYALGNLGTVYTHLGEPQRSIELYEKALKITRRLGDRHDEGTGLSELGLAYLAAGNVSHAIKLLEESLRIHRETGYLRGECSTLDNLGMAYFVSGKFRRGINVMEQALAVARETGDRRGESATLGNLGFCYCITGRVILGLKYLRNGLTIARDIGDVRSERNNLLVMCLSIFKRDRTQVVRDMETFAQRSNDLGIPDEQNRELLVELRQRASRRWWQFWK